MSPVHEPPPPPRRGPMQRRFPWWLLVGVWILPGLVNATQMYVAFNTDDYAISFLTAALWVVPAWQVYTLLTPPIVWLARRLPFERARNLVVHVVAAIVASVLFNAAWLSCGVLVGVKSFGDPMGTIASLTLRQSIVTVLAYGLIVAATWVREHQRTSREGALAQAELAAQLAEAQLDALRMQLHPHFLFNTLNAVAVLMRKHDLDRATRMLNGLSDLLRIALDNVGLQLVPLREELGFIDRYIEIEQIRFGDRVRVLRSIAPDVLDARIPNLLLQPLVENALKHGLEPLPHGGQLELNARRHAGRLRIEIRDDGAGLNGTRARGIGLKNVRARLERLYQSDQSFTLEPASPGVRAVVEIPYQETR
jgi:two-component system, LytTR family, sensor kinase